MTNIVSVPFHGDAVTAVETPQGVYVAVLWLCERLGVSRQMQQRKLNADPRLWRVKLMMLPSAGGAQETLCIPLNRVAMWLASISPRKVRPEVRETLIAYQTEAADVLDRHFRLRAEAEVGEAHAALVRLREDLIARKPLWVKIRSWQAMGWSFDRIWRASGRTRAVVIEAVSDLLRCDLIPAAPAGTPFARPLQAQADLFAGA